MIYANNDLLIGSINIDKKSNLVKTEITKLDGTYSITFKFIGKGNFKLLTLKFLK